MPRPASKSSTFLRRSENRTYISTTSRITSGELLKLRNGLGGLALDRRLMPTATTRFQPCHVALTAPADAFERLYDAERVWASL